jgi:threonine aldolase
VSAAWLSDLRSDTVTQPSTPMRRAMAEAEVGDNVLDGDPTTRRLEQRVAELLGTDDALFVPSGTQANQTGVALLARPGTELVLEANAHLVHYDLAGAAANWGVQIRPVATPDGLLTGELLRGALRPASPHVPRVGGVAVENTHPAAGGRVMPVAVMAGVVAMAAQAGLRVHLDGARLWNAAAALGIPVARLARGAASVMVRFSKGLGCPVGSCLAFAAGDRALAWEIRKRLGVACASPGSWPPPRCGRSTTTSAAWPRTTSTQRSWPTRLCDHPTFRATAPETNIVMLDPLRESDTAAAVIPRLAEAGVLVTPFGPRRLRAVTHLDVGSGDVERAAGVIAAYWRDGRTGSPPVMLMR